MDNSETARSLKGLDRITCNGKEIILIGTAHVSRDSARLVTQMSLNSEQSRYSVCGTLRNQA